MARAKLIEVVQFQFPAHGLPVGTFNPGHVFEGITEEAAAALIEAGHAIDPDEDPEDDAGAGSSEGTAPKPKGKPAKGRGAKKSGKPSE